MTWEQKLQAMNALGVVDLRMIKPGAWYASPSHIEIGGDGLLSSTGGQGATPEAAVEAVWEKMTDLESGKYIVLGAGTDDRKHVRWNGFMWEEIPREKIKAS